MSSHFTSPSCGGETENWKKRGQKNGAKEGGKPHACQKEVLLLRQKKVKLIVQTPLGRRAQTLRGKRERREVHKMTLSLSVLRHLHEHSLSRSNSCAGFPQVCFVRDDLKKCGKRWIDLKKIFEGILHSVLHL